MYGSDNAWECEWCKVRNATVKTRTVMCGDTYCRCEYDAIVCKACADRTYE